jgi:hypothetical protein
MEVGDIVCVLFGGKNAVLFAAVALPGAVPLGRGVLCAWLDERGSRASASRRGGSGF